MSVSVLFLGVAHRRTDGRHTSKYKHVDVNAVIVEVGTLRKSSAKENASEERKKERECITGESQPEARSSGINEPNKALARQTVELSGIDYSSLAGKPHPQPSDCQEEKTKTKWILIVV